MSGLIVPFKGFTPRIAASAVRAGELWAGNPGQKLRDLTEKDVQSFQPIAAQYVEMAKAYRTEQCKAAD